MYRAANSGSGEERHSTQTTGDDIIDDFTSSEHWSR